VVFNGLYPLAADSPYGGHLIALLSCSLFPPPVCVSLLLQGENSQMRAYGKFVSYVPFMGFLYHYRLPRLPPEVTFFLSFSFDFLPHRDGLPMRRTPSRLPLPPYLLRERTASSPAPFPMDQAALLYEVVGSLPISGFLIWS